MKTENIESLLKKVGLHVPEILLPGPDVDYTSYSVIACDQYSADREYWEKVENIVGNSVSTLRMICPEAYLGRGVNSDEICEKMRQYLDNGALRSAGEGFVFVKRETHTGIRKGIVAAVDLECYDFKKGGSLIRATEQTVVDRLPARVAIRKKAPLELPHILVLFEDPEDKVISAAEELTAGDAPLYDFDLMMNGGHITGYMLSGDSDTGRIAGLFNELLDDSEGCLFAMGDGNHSLAAAKMYWDSIKEGLSPEMRENHPARYALCELVNVYDGGLGMWPIHRLLLNVNPDEVCKDLNLDPMNPPDLQEFQPVLDEWLAGHPEAELEYIHGREEALELQSRNPDSLAVVFPDFDKSSVFRYARQNKIFQRKSFSIGVADEKRFYLEARRITL